MDFRDLNTIVYHPTNVYVVAFRKELESLSPKLWENLELTPSLPAEKGEAVIAYLLELYCQCQNYMNIELGAAGLMALPKNWLNAHIEGVAEKMLLCPEEKSAYRDLLALYPSKEPRVGQSV